MIGDDFAVIDFAREYLNHFLSGIFVGLTRGRVAAGVVVRKDNPRRLNKLEAIHQSFIDFGILR